jgi:hypothetical protein
MCAQIVSGSGARRTGRNFMNHYIVKPDRRTPQSMSMTWDIKAESPEEAINEMLKCYDEGSWPDHVCVYAKADEFKASVPLLLAWDNPNKKLEDIETARVAGELTLVLKHGTVGQVDSLLRAIGKLCGDEERLRLQQWVDDGMPGA